MDRFVCVRVVQAWGLDLNVFQFDFWTTWTVFLLNADKALYGRYASRGRNDVEGLRTALAGALELHGKYPSNKEELAGKVGAPLGWRYPEELPAIREKGRFRDAVDRGGCIHCHNIQEGLEKSFKTSGQRLPDRVAAYPTPERAGITLAPGERATVTDIGRSSPAEKAGLRPGDRILRAAGQPILSIADVEWALHSSADAGPVKLEVEREGARRELRLALPPGWRSRD